LIRSNDFLFKVIKLKNIYFNTLATKLLVNWKAKFHQIKFYKFKFDGKNFWDFGSSVPPVLYLVVHEVSGLKHFIFKIYLFRMDDIIDEYNR
jgi:hypothetical protein